MGVQHVQTHASVPGCTNYLRAAMVKGSSYTKAAAAKAHSSRLAAS